MSLRYGSAVPLICLGLIAAAPGRANDIRFDQSNPTIMTLNITQSGTDHAVHGFAAGSNTPDPTAGATLKGNFGTVNLQQTSPTGSAIALRVEVGEAALSDISINLSGGPHRVALDAVAGKLSSVINLEGAEAKAVTVNVDAPGKEVSHDIALSGSTTTLTANQRVAAALSVNLNATGPGAMATITQTGEGSTAHILGNIDSGAELIFNQSSIGADYTLDVELAPDSKLTFNQEADGGPPVGSRAVLTTGQTVVMTHSRSEGSTPVIITE
jgi:hypothetical protein